MIPRVVAVAIYALIGMLVLVVGVGVMKGGIDFTPVAVTLAGALSGAVGGALLRAKNESDRDGKP